MAAETRPPLEEPANNGLAEWITALPAAEKDTLLTMAPDGDGAQVQDLLLRRFRGSDTDSTTRSLLSLPKILMSAFFVRDRPGRARPRKSENSIDSRAQPGEPSLANVTRRIEFHQLDS